VFGWARALKGSQGDSYRNEALKSSKRPHAFHMFLPWPRAACRPEGDRVACGCNAIWILLRKYHPRPEVGRLAVHGIDWQQCTMQGSTPRVDARRLPCMAMYPVWSKCNYNKPSEFWFNLGTRPWFEPHFTPKKGRRKKAASAQLTYRNRQICIWPLPFSLSLVSSPVCALGCLLATVQLAPKHNARPWSTKWFNLAYIAMHGQPSNVVRPRIGGQPNLMHILSHLALQRLGGGWDAARPSNRPSSTRHHNTEVCDKRSRILPD